VEDLARAWCGIGIFCKANDLTRRLKQEAQRCIVLAPFEVGYGVTLSLGFNNGEVFARAVFLGLDNTHGLAVDEQHIVSRAGIGGVFAYRHTHRCAEVELLHVLNDPARLLQLLVDLLACFSFWCHVSSPLTVSGSIAHPSLPVVDRTL
jgi:hypothetical protein